MPRDRTVAIAGTRGYPSYYGGLETAVRKIAPYLADNGWTVTVLGTESDTVADDPGRDPRIHTVSVWSLRTRSLSKLSSGLASTVSMLRHPPDVALVMSTALGFWLPLLRARGITTVVNTDGLEWKRDKWGTAAKFVLHAAARATARWADELIFDARAIADFWEAHFGRSGTFIPYGGDPLPSPQLPEGLPSKGYVLMVARFVPENTVPEFFEAVPVIAAKTPVVIVGSSGFGGGLDDDARTLARTFPSVTWLGHVRDDALLNALYAHAGVYFHGHSVGGTNPSLVQAMAVGAPVVARDTVYNREVLGDEGVFCSPAPQDIAAAVNSLMQDSARRAEIGAANHERASREYTWELVCAAYARVLENAVSGARHRPRRSRPAAGR
ncbi:MAG TPA: glycosyltransferase family 1 protein [Actinomycetales bacterium]|nr:glycosyltransferase family 1 protein [Actinomycetales bacterium]